MNTFTENIGIILQNAERILSDRKIFFVPLPFDNYFAKDLRLGELLEWWNENECSHIDIEGKRWYVFHLLGNPMTGSNSCGIVSEDGITMHTFIPGFAMLWKSLATIVAKYKNESEESVPYILDDIIIMLKNTK